ncbi:hypothetical protein F4561_001174 [Lipingzhangella halophila]|uniref:Uncharacterized protein n=1 Tax=Lipingzhangella halophila TaxID=1783352 RepID=A0A7W7RED1_9ACTN|nr:hypothetical protein [Lipingzhangella halophila]
MRARQAHAPTGEPATGRRGFRTAGLATAGGRSFGLLGMRVERVTECRTLSGAAPTQSTPPGSPGRVVPRDSPESARRTAVSESCCRRCPGRPARCPSRGLDPTGSTERRTNK